MACLFPPLVFLLLWSYLLPAASAQTSFLRWSFADFTSSASTLVACGTIPLIVSGGQPPYYMLAYEPTGSTTSHLLMETDDSNRWTWKVDRPSGTRLLLGIVDSTGATGGVSATQRVVQDGGSSTASCVPMNPPDVTSSTSPVVITSTTGGVGSTTEPARINVTGGVPPYTISVVEQGGSVLNATLTSQDASFTYVVRTNPGSNSIVTASDALGVWSKHSLYLVASVQSDSTSIGTATYESNDVLGSLASPPQPPGHSNTTVIVGVTLGALLFLFIVGLPVCYTLVSRHRSQNGDPESTVVGTQSWYSKSKLAIVRNIPANEHTIDLTRDDIFISTPSSPKVLDISPANRPPSHESIVPSPSSSRISSPPVLYAAHYLVPPVEPLRRAATVTLHRPPLRTQPQTLARSQSSSPLSPQSPQSSSMHASSPQSPIRPLPRVPSRSSALTTVQRFAKAQEAALEAEAETQRRLRSVRSAGDMALGREIRGSRDPLRSRSLLPDQPPPPYEPAGL